MLRRIVKPKGGRVDLNELVKRMLHFSNITNKHNFISISLNLVHPCLSERESMPPKRRNIRHWEGGHTYLNLYRDFTRLVGKMLVFTCVYSLIKDG